MHLTVTDGEIDALQYFFVAYSGVKILYFLLTITAASMSAPARASVEAVETK